MRVRATSTREKPIAHSGPAVSFGPFSCGIKPPPNCATSVKVCGSPPWSTAIIGVPSSTVSESGSKSHLSLSGVPACASENNVAIGMDAPSATFLQKPAPTATLNVAGSHSSNATTCAGVLWPSCCSITPANRRQQAAKPIFISAFVMVFSSREPMRPGFSDGLAQAFYLCNRKWRGKDDRGQTRFIGDKSNEAVTVEVGAFLLYCFATALGAIWLNDWRSRNWPFGSFPFQ